MESLRCILICVKCNKFYNTTTRVPLNLPCQDVICKQCYEFEYSQVQSQIIICPFDADHLFERTARVIESQIILRYLQQYDFYSIQCSVHQDENARNYCKVEDKILCGRCILSNPHEHQRKKRETHFDIKREYLEDSFQKVLQHSQLDESVIKKIKDQSDLNTFLANFSYQQANKHEQERLYSEQIRRSVPSSIPTLKIPLYLEFKRLMEIELSRDELSLIKKHIDPLRSITYSLIYKGIRDGFLSSKFHEICDNKGSTVSFILSDSGQVFGGYTSKPWNSDGKYQKDSGAFLFSLSKRTVHKQYQNRDYAVQNNKNALLAFGYGHDILIPNNCQIQNCSTKLGATYMIPSDTEFNEIECEKYFANTQNFKVVDIEVYKVVIN
ncbi:tldc domain-containing protein [Stylonychia lemnae]|uniref:Tldc domain-containing protein n=1 Tax=Stylonychia lemnae TaxID=5949 RepID=A0A078AYY0_STYLE|nr:tldc domain-containing protein [Stylonychia lemnae]|eukprot:CDW87369.1 tldc domain-containing protein [Stylonychia lemnae]